MVTSTSFINFSKPGISSIQKIFIERFSLLSTMEISIIVPAYNEEKRIPPFLEKLLQFSKKIPDYEIIFVNDGSADGTLDLLKSASKKDRHIRIIGHSKNQGKGYAVRQGILAARGRKLIFIDADGSIDPREIAAMSRNLDRYEVVIGSRTHPSSQVRQTFTRKLTSLLFNLYADLLFGIGFGDKLCGFKGFRRDVARSLFGNLLSKRWVFDIELLYLIKRRGYSLFRQPLTWVHKGESKMRLLDPLKIAFELIILRIRLISRRQLE
jgi:dolichyl-phosphate beta-glucosyltransferase